MAAIPIRAQGTEITIDVNGVATKIFGVTSITGIGSGSATEIDVTTLDSTAKEFIQGLRDFGSITINVIRNQDDPGQLAAFDLMAMQETTEFVVTLPTSTADVITFQGFVTQITLDVAADDAVRGDITVRITGAPTFS